jgi:hypothetical protein
MKKTQSFNFAGWAAAAFLAFALLVPGCQTAPDYPGYKVIEKRFVPEVNAECIYLEHEASGARLFKIAADDPNKTFCVAFQTVPETDAGTPHIMEHSVLNGSKNFPVKSPFDVLMKGSLNTFLNAMTGSDFTMYPVASMNDKDYFNLMHVYLDAVFNPLIYDDPRIFMQEGWHYELTDKDAPMTIKGVVYNEMKGSFSSPTRELMFQIMKNLFPENGYSHSSGGYPPAIPDLSYEEFLDFHRRYYHPSNSYILLYGDADLSKELEFIDREYLSQYEESEFEAGFPLNPPFDAVKEVEKSYSVMPGAPVEDQTYLALNFVIGQNTDEALVMSLDALSDVLVNQESAPVRLALQEAGIGKDVTAMVNPLHQNVFMILAMNANPEDKDAFRKTIMDTLQKVSEEGLDKEAIEGTLNRMEFRLREGNTSQKGLSYLMQMRSGWMFAGDPFQGLEYEKTLAEVKKALDEPVLEDLIRTGMINNPYGLMMVMKPEPGLEQQRMKEQAAALAEYKAGLSEEELNELVETTRELMAYQQREDSPEALAAIPMLELEDIGKEAAWYGLEEKQEAGVPVLFHPEFTNQVLYTNLFFDLRALPQDKIAYASLLTELLGAIATENYSYGDLDKALQIHTGGFNTSLSTYLENQDDDRMIPKFRVSVKSTRNKLEKALELTQEIITAGLFDDTERVGELLNRHQAGLEARMKQGGLQVAGSRISSYLFNEGLFREKTGGAEYYWWVTDLTKKYAEDPQIVLEELSQAANSLFRKSNLIAAVTCSEEDYSAFAQAWNTFAAALSEGETQFQEWNFQPEPANEAFLTDSKVQYVVKGYDYKELGYEWDGRMHVLNQVLSTDWLQTRIRVMGGAYGGFARTGKDGSLYFMSYRDPNLKETLENYDATAEYLKNFEADETAMTRYIIGTVSNLDNPLTASRKGDMAVQYYFEKTTAEELQQDRDRVLQTTADDLKAMAPMIQDILGQNVICVYGSETRIRENRDLFNELVVLQK